MPRELTQAEKELNDKWQKKTPYEHIIDLPDTYIGSTILDKSDQYIYVSESINNSNNETNENENSENETNESIENETNKNKTNENEINKNKTNENEINENKNETNENKNNQNLNKNINLIKQKKINYVPGLFKIFDEIIVNANDNKNRIDNKIKNKEKGLSKMTKLKVNIFKLKDEDMPEKYAISVLNDGDGIDVALHPTEKIFIPQMIFGELLTSGNYNKSEEKVTGGKNGYGAKLANIFSKYFCIETADKHRKLHYKQIYRNNMLQKTEPVITKFTGKPYTKITFIPDYERFSMKDLTDDFIALFKKRTMDMTFCSQGTIMVSFNEILLNKLTSTDYMKMYLPIEYSVPFSSCKPHSRWQIGACMSHDFQFKQISFVNGIFTSRGGSHVNYVTKKITSALSKWIKEKKKIDVRDSFIKDNLMLFVNSLIVNPSFDSQTKETLTTNAKDFGSKFEIESDFINNLAKSGIVERAMAQTQYQESQKLTKTDGKKIKRILDIEKLEDARLAGTKNGSKCSLIFTEGDSAKATAVTGLSSLENGRDFYGIFPFRGKLLNTRDKSDVVIAGNKEICNIKRILGLQEGQNYLNTSKLRYGRIIIMTDQDVDGSHIKGLLINYISSKFPSLLQIDGFITSILTPIVKTWKKGKKDKANQFYSLPEYESWLNNNNDGYGYQTKYYKGLGTSTPEEARSYFKDFKLVVYHWDDLSNESIDKAFNKDRTDDRKDWLLNFNDQILDLGQLSVTFTDFINCDLIQFSMEDNHRSLPHLMDGVKPSQRKILYCSFKRNLVNEIKVAQLAGYVSENGAYHHGEASLQGAIVGMAQNYPGTNNINLLVPEGQFGTRLQGGKDFAAPRYIFTYLSSMAQKLFNKSDNPLLKYTTDDGQKVEPEFYTPILPLALINGSDGIGTGWSSKIPQFNPIDLIKNIRLMIDGKEPKEIHPWYRGFKGSIIKLEKNSWMTKGVYKLVNKTTIEITELPIGTWTNNYKEMLDKMVIGLPLKEDKKGSKGKGGKAGKAKKTQQSNKSKNLKIQKIDDKSNKDDGRILKDYINESSDISVKFTLKFEMRHLSKLLNNIDRNGVNDFERMFKLTTKLSCNKTINLFGVDGKLLNLKSITEVQQKYFDSRIEYYNARKAYDLKEMRKVLGLLSVRGKFIMDIINKKIIINNKPKVEIIEQLEKNNYPKMFDGILYTLTNLKSGKCQSHIIKDSNYNYLINMPIYNLTKEKIEELMKEKDKIQASITTLEKKSPGDIWNEDLVEFENEYTKFMKAYYKYYSLDPKDFKNSCRSKQKIDLGDMFSAKKEIKPKRKSPTSKNKKNESGNSKSNLKSKSKSNTIINPNSLNNSDYDMLIAKERNEKNKYKKTKDTVSNMD